MERLSQLTNIIYQIHENGKNILIKKEINQALKFECLLYFNYIHGITKELNDLRYLLQGMHKIGKDSFTSFEYELDIMNQKLNLLSSKTQMDKAINYYRNLEEHLQLFDLNNLFETKKEVDFFEDRINIYKEYFKKIEKPKKDNGIQVKQDIPYIELERQKINIAKYKLPIYNIPEPAPRKGGEIKILIKDLKLAAKEMDEIIAGKDHLEKQNYEERMEKFEVLINDKYGLTSPDSINIKEVCHIIGMVGTGKSTLIQVLIYYLSKNGYRTMALFETVKDVLDNAYLFENLGVLTSAFNGERKQDDRVQKVIESKEMIVSEKYANNLIGNCYISHLANGKFDDLIMYGSEPCYQMKYNGKSTLCPFYSICPRKENSYKLYNASVIFANINSLLYSRTGLIKDKGRLLLLEYAIEYVDVVIFDEADAMQIRLDRLLNQSEYAEKILDYNLEKLYPYLKNAINDDNDFSNIRDLYVTFNIVNSALSDLKNYLTRKSIGEKFYQIKNGQWFSAYLLSFSIDFLPENFRKDYKKVIENEDSSFLGMREVYLSFSDTLEERYFDFYQKYNINEENHDYVRFLMALVITEKNILSLQYELEKIQRDNNEAIIDTNMPKIFMRPNEKVLRLLPKSPTNNRFGFLYDKEKQKLQIFRQNAIGRSIMTDLPYLKINEDGKPIGPHTILISGSSFVPESSEHHIQRPVNYVLETTSNKARDFINKIKIQHINTEIKVSGKSNKKEALMSLCLENEELFKKAFNENGRSLVIVNSYEQAKWVQSELNNMLFTNKVFRLIPDSDLVTEANNTIQRSKVNQSKEIDYKFLVAPAISIARGFNIVDETGHSLFNKMFVLVRPMSKPKEIDTVTSIVNGEVISLLSKKITSPHLTEELERIKKSHNKAHAIWINCLRDFYNIEYSDEILKRNIVVSRFVLLTQLIGRLLRITNVDLEPPEIILLDQAFVGNKMNEFNLLEEIEGYLESMMKNPSYGILMEKLYSPFLEGVKRGKVHV